MLLRDLHVVYSVSTIRVMVWRFVYSVSTSRVLVSKLGGALPKGCVARTTGVQTGCAVMATFQNRVVLVQGPPGTGKTTTSAAIVCIHRCVTGGCLVCTSSNVAADTFGAVLKKKNEPFLRFWF